MSDFSNLYIYKMLHIIRHKSSIEELLKLGLNYSQVSQLLSDVTKKGYVEDQGENDLQVTKLGLDFLEENLKKIHPHDNKDWIMPLDSEKIQNRLNIFDIYLPERKKQ